jgi:hypothetical protein
MKTKTKYYSGSVDDTIVWRLRNGKVTFHSELNESMDSAMTVAHLNGCIKRGRLIEITKKQAEKICGRPLE